MGAFKILTLSKTYTLVRPLVLDQRPLALSLSILLPGCKQIPAAGESCMQFSWNNNDLRRSRGITTAAVVPPRLGHAIGFLR